MKRIAITIYILLTSFTMFGQSTGKLFSHAQQDFENRDYKKALDKYKEVISKFEIKETFDSNYLNVLNSYNLASIYSRDYDQALKSYNKIIDYTQKYNLKHENIDARVSIISILMLKRKLDTAEIVINNILRTDSLRYFTKSNCYNFLGRIYNERENLDESIKFYKKAIAIDKTNQDSSSMPFSCLDLATTYSAIDSQKMAIKYLILGEKHLRPKKDNYKKTVFLNRFGLIYYDLGNMIKAEKYATDQLILAQNMGLRKSNISAYILLGDINIYNQLPNEALAFYNKADSINQILKYKHYKALISLGLMKTKLVNNTSLNKNDQIELKSIKKQIPKGTRMWNSIELMEFNFASKSLSKKDFKDRYHFLYTKFDSIKKPSLIRELTHIKYNYFKDKHQYNEALSTLEEYNNLKEKMRQNNNAFSLEELETKYQSEKKELEIKLLDEQNKIKNSKIDSLYLTLSLGSLALFVLALLSFYLFKLNTKINKQKTIISKALKDKEVLMREIHHRVKNNLQLISSLLTLQGRSINNETAIQAINEGKSRVRSMALIHQDLYNKENLTEICVKDYLEKLAFELFTTYNIDNDKIKLELDIQNLDIDVDTLVPLGLIINELITNSLKYAFPNNKSGKIEIKLFEKNKNLIFSIHDNGIGFDIDMTKDNSFGTTLVSALTAQLEGEITINTNNGTNVNIVFYGYKTN